MPAKEKFQKKEKTHKETNPETLRLRSDPRYRQMKALVEHPWLKRAFNELGDETSSVSIVDFTTSPSDMDVYMGEEKLPYLGFRIRVDWGFHKNRALSFNEYWFAVDIKLTADREIIFVPVNQQTLLSSSLRLPNLYTNITTLLQDMAKIYPFR